MLSRPEFSGSLILFAFFLLALAIVPLFPVGSAPAAEAQDADAGVSDVVSDVMIESSTRSPAAVSRYVVKFTTPDDSILRPGTDFIGMELHEDIRVPRGINPAAVRVKFEKAGENVEDDMPRNGTAANVELVDNANPRAPTLINIYFAIRGGSDAPLVPIPGGSEVTVTFTKNAGIRNPTEGGPYSWKVWTSKDREPVAAKASDGALKEAFRQSSSEDVDTGLLVDREIQLSKEEAGRGERITVIARGYKNGTTLAVWRDANADGRLDSDEVPLCDTAVLANDIGYCNFTISVPPFVADTGKCDDASPALTCNLINARDGLGDTSVIYNEDGGAVQDVDQVLKLVGRVKASNVQGPGGNIQVQLTDFPQGMVCSVDIGGVPVDLDPLRVGSSGTLHFSIAVPNGVRLGRQSLQVVVHEKGCDNDEETYSQRVVVVITHPNTVVRIIPETVLPNQRVSLSGTGFSDESGTTIERLRIGGHDISPTRINGGGGIELSGDGGWTGSLDLPIVEATMTPGVHHLQLWDSQGRNGSVEFTVPPREISVEPVWGGPGTLVTVKGSGFPARNDNGSSFSILIRYEFEGGGALATAHTDAFGAFSQQIRVPLNAPRPSSNFLRVEFRDDEGRSVTTSDRHEVPAATVELSPVSGPPGTAVTVTGSGFRSFARVDEMVIGNIDVSPGTSTTTDANGRFIVRFVAPGIGRGNQSLRVSVAGVTASGSFEIKESGVSPGNATPVAEAVEGLLDALQVIFHFSDDAKTWTFYEPGVPGVEDDGGLERIIAGEPYWIQVSETVEVVLNGRVRRLSCLEGSCWNHIVW